MYYHIRLHISDDDQGGVISSTLFLVFIDDIADDMIPRISRALHADDLALWTAEVSLSSAGARMQRALDKLDTYTKKWGVELNKTKTVYTVFSLSPQQEKVTLQFQGRILGNDVTPRYLGLKLDRRLTWKPHIEQAQAKATRRISIMKKLAGTTWGASPKILKTIYTGAIRPVIEYGNTSWATAAHTNTQQLSKVQNTSLRLITGALKTTPIRAMETTADLRPLESRREEKVFIHSEKIRRLHDHKLNSKIGELTKNRLKRPSFNHLAREIRTKHEGLLPHTADSIEPLSAFHFSSLPPSVDISLVVPGILEGKTQPPCVMKTLTMTMIQERFDSRLWAQIYTDGSADQATRNGGAGVLIRLPNSEPISLSYATGMRSTNFRAEAVALLHGARAVLALDPVPDRVVFLSDSRSILELLGNPQRGDTTVNEARTILSTLATRSQVCLQWIPAHCGLEGNERADTLAKQGSKKEQFEHRISYSEAKAIIKSTYNKAWNEQRRLPDNISSLNRLGQSIIFRLRTGHCRLRAHLYRINISDTPDCQCGTAQQTPEHILQECPLLTQQRNHIWPLPESIETKLYGSGEDLKRTVQFASSADLSI